MTFLSMRNPESSPRTPEASLPEGITRKLCENEMQDFLALGQSGTDFRGRRDFRPLVEGMMDFIVANDITDSTDLFRAARMACERFMQERVGRFASLITQRLKAQGQPYRQEDVMRYARTAHDILLNQAQASSMTEEQALFQAVPREIRSYLSPQTPPRQEAATADQEDLIPPPEADEAELRDAFIRKAERLVTDLLGRHDLLPLKTEFLLDVTGLIATRFPEEDTTPGARELAVKRAVYVRDCFFQLLFSHLILAFNEAGRQAFPPEGNDVFFAAFDLEADEIPLDQEIDALGAALRVRTEQAKGNPDILEDLLEAARTIIHVNIGGITLARDSDDSSDDEASTEVITPQTQARMKIRTCLLVAQNMALGQSQALSKSVGGLIEKHNLVLEIKRMAAAFFSGKNPTVPASLEAEVKEQQNLADEADLGIDYPYLQEIFEKGAGDDAHKKPFLSHFQKAATAWLLYGELPASERTLWSPATQQAVEGLTNEEIEGVAKHTIDTQAFHTSVLDGARHMAVGGESLHGKTPQGFDHHAIIRLIERKGLPNLLKKEALRRAKYNLGVHKRPPVKALSVFPPSMVEAVTQQIDNHYHYTKDMEHACLDTLRAEALETERPNLDQKKFDASDIDTVLTNAERNVRDNFQSDVEACRSAFEQGQGFKQFHPSHGFPKGRWGDLVKEVAQALIEKETARASRRQCERARRPLWKREKKRRRTQKNRSKRRR